MDYGEEGQHYEEGEGGDDEHNPANLYHNNHDLIGVEGIIRAQKNEIEKKKVRCWLYHNDSVARAENRE
jgi:hypothetical protein